MAELVIFPYWWSHWYQSELWLYSRISDNISPLKARNRNPKEECQTQTPNRRLTLTPDGAQFPPLCHIPLCLYSTPLSLIIFPHFPHNSHTHTRSTTSVSVLQLNGKKKTFPTFSQGSEAAIGCPCNWVCKCGRWVVGGRWWEGSGSGIGSGFVVVGRQAALGYVDSVVWLLSVCSARQYWCTMNQVCIHLVLIKYVLRIWVKVLKLLKNYLCIVKLNILQYNLQIKQNIKSFLSVHWLVFGRIIVKWPCTCRPFCF